MARHTAKNPAPKRCATCTFCRVNTFEPGASLCRAPLPVWVDKVFEDELDGVDGGVVNAKSHSDPKCPLWQARGPTTH